MITFTLSPARLLVLDGVYRREGEGRLRFVRAPSWAELKRLVQRMAERIGRSLERSGVITRDIESASSLSRRVRAREPGSGPELAPPLPTRPTSAARHQPPTGNGP